MHIYLYMYICIYILYMYTGYSMVLYSSSSYRAASTDIPDPLSLLLPIVNRLWQVFRAPSCILT